MAQRGELGEREAVVDREVFLWREDRDGGRVWEKHHPTQSSWRESGKVETATGTELKREKRERRGFKFH